MIINCITELNTGIFSLDCNPIHSRLFELIGNKHLGTYEN